MPKVVGRNDSCPCGTGAKYKQCCEGKLDWNKVLRAGHGEWKKHLSIRGRNLLFADRVAEILQIDNLRPGDLKGYKSAFTSEAVRKIHEAVMEVWPPDVDVALALKHDSSDVSGLYIGDYDLTSISQGLVRHSTYANKILVVDPFVYPSSVRDKFNPILEPDQHRTQTLKNFNFWIALLPWVRAGIVEIVRTPADFDRKLQWDSMVRQQLKFDTNAELKEALELSTEEMQERRGDTLAREVMLLSMPDEALLETFQNLGLEKSGISEKQFLDEIQAQRDANPNFLKPLGSEFPGQLHMFSAGTSYDIAKITARLTGSYLFTDLGVRWKEIELDRAGAQADSHIWSPFAHAMQNAPLKYLNHVRLDDALKLRAEGRLESLRRFLTSVWRKAQAEPLFDASNARLMAEELAGEMAKAEIEWREIDQDLLKSAGASIGASVAGSAAAIVTGQAFFLAAATAAAGAATAGVMLAHTYAKRKGFADRYPAAFYMKIKQRD